MLAFQTLAQALLHLNLPLNPPRGTESRVNAASAAVSPSPESRTRFLHSSEHLGVKRGEIIGWGAIVKYGPWSFKYRSFSFTNESRATVPERHSTPTAARMEAGFYAIYRFSI